VKVNDKINRMMLWIKPSTIASPCLLFIFLMLYAGVADGQSAAVESGEEAAKKHFKVGAILYNDEDYTGALVEFRASYAAKKNPKVCRYAALFLQALNRYAEAEKELKNCLEECADKVTPEVKKEIDTLLAQLAEVIGSVDVKCAVEGAEVLFNGKSVGTTPLPKVVRLDLGHYKMQVRKEGYEDYEADFDLPGGETVTMNIELKMKPKSLEQKAPISPQEEKASETEDKNALAEAILLAEKIKMEKLEKEKLEKEKLEKIKKEKEKALKKNPYKMAGQGLLNIGVFLLSTGTVTTVLAYEMKKDYYKYGKAESKDLNAKFSSIAVSSYTIGGTMVVLGIVIYALNPKYKKKIEKRYNEMGIAAAMDSSGAALIFSGRW